MKAGIVIKALCPVVAIVLCNGCASGGPPQPPSLELPVPVSDLRAVRKGDRVYLAWTVPTETTDHENIRHPGPTRICRSAASNPETSISEIRMTQCGTPVGTLAAGPLPSSWGKRKTKKHPGPAKTPKTTASFADVLPALPGLKLDDEVAYAVEVLNSHDESAGLSNQVRVPAYPAPAAPAGFAATVGAGGVRFSWQCTPAASAPVAGMQSRLRVYRRVAGSENDEIAAEGDLNDCTGKLLDQTFEWEKTYDYRAAAVLVVSREGKPQLEIESDDSPSVRVFAHDVFPPAVPTGLQAVFSGVGQQPFVDLVWTPDSDTDLAGYNVYRHEAGASPVKLNRDLVQGPAYRDSNLEPGKQYFYSVSAVDVRGNESAKSGEATERVPE